MHQWHARARLRMIMVNYNPETVSTDYDVSDHMKAITSERILDIIEVENPDGAIIQFGVKLL